MGVVGPATDHTLRNRNGHYMYVEGTRGVFGQAAKLQSPPLSPFASSCVMYMYYYTAPHIGRFEVGFVSDNTTYRYAIN